MQILELGVGIKKLPGISLLCAARCQAWFVHQSQYQVGQMAVLCELFAAFGFGLLALKLRKVIDINPQNY